MRRSLSSGSIRESATPLGHFAAQLFADISEWRVSFSGRSTELLFLSESLFGSVGFVEDDGGNDFTSQNLLFLPASYSGIFFYSSFTCGLLERGTRILKKKKKIKISRSKIQK